MAAMSDAQPSKLNLWVDFLATNQVDETSAPLLLHAVRASLDIGGVWIRQPKALNMKCLLGLLLVMGMVGCGGEGDAPPAGESALPPTPKNPQAKVDEPPVQTVDFSKLVQRDGLMHEGDSETPFTGVAVDEWRRGKKWFNSTYKDGKQEGLTTVWHPNGEKASEETYKDGEVVSETKWDEEGNEINK